MFIVVAANGDLIAGLIFGIFFLLLFSGITIKLIVDVLNKQKISKRTRNSLLIPVSLFFCGIGLYITLSDYNFLKNPVYVEGITVGYCLPGKTGKGIKFEYYLNGTKYSNCSYIDPLFLYEIQVPGGKFIVKATEYQPELGQIDFNQPLFIEVD